MASMTVVHYLENRVERLAELKERELQTFSEKLAEQIRESNAIQGALYRKIDTVQETNRQLKFSNALMNDAISRRDCEIRYLNHCQQTLNNHHHAQVELLEYLQEHLIDLDSENKLLKEQQMQRLEREQQQHHQVLQLKEQMANLAAQNQQLRQQASRAEALLQQLNQTKVEATVRDSRTSQGLKADSGSSSSSSSSSVSPHVGAADSAEQSQFPGAAVSDERDTAAGTNNAADAVSVMGRFLSSHSVISTGRIPADSMESATANAPSTASSGSGSGSSSSSSAGTSQQDVCLEGSGTAWQKLCTAWADGWFGAH